MEELVNIKEITPYEFHESNVIKYNLFTNYCFRILLSNFFNNTGIETKEDIDSPNLIVDLIFYNCKIINFKSEDPSFLIKWRDILDFHIYDNNTAFFHTMGYFLEFSFSSFQIKKLGVYDYDDVLEEGVNEKIYNEIRKFPEEYFISKE